MVDQCRTNSFRPVHSIVGCMHFIRQNGTMSERNSLVLTLMSFNPFWLLKGKQEAQRERERESRTANPIGAMPEERKNSREGSRESATLVIRSLYLLGYTRGTDVSRGWRNCKSIELAQLHHRRHGSPATAKTLAETTSLLIHGKRETGTIV